MLTRLILKNFKSWEKVDLKFGKITGLFGTNSSGKSSLIQFLLLLKQTKDATDRAIALDLNGRFVQLGTMLDVIHKHESDRELAFFLGFRSDQSVAVSDPSYSRNKIVARSSELAISAHLEIYEQRPRSRTLQYRVGDAEFTLKRSDDGSAKFELKAKIPDSDFRFVRTTGRAWKLPEPSKTYQFPDQARTYYQNAAFLADLEAKLEIALDRLFYLGPLRDYPRRDYLWARSRPSDVGEKGERAIDAILAAQEAGIMLNLKPKGRKKPFAEIIAFWLREMGLIHSFRVVEIAKGSNRWQAKIQTRHGGTEVLLTDVGFGVSQVLPVIALLYYVPEGSTVVLEQPEIHLHPLAQAGLADVIINAATHRKIQVVLESHSEHLLLRLQRRIAEQEIDSKDVRLYFCDAPKDKSRIEELELNLLGRIENWPDQFMGDAFSETAQAETARLNRLKATAE